MLTKNQLYQLRYHRFQWKTNESLAGALRNWGFDITPSMIGDRDTFIDTFLRIQGRQYIQAVRDGEIKTNYTPTDIHGEFLIPKNPMVGRTYHLSWAYRGARFKLRKIEPPYCYLDNPKYKRETLLKAKLSDLRIPRGGQPH